MLFWRQRTRFSQSRVSWTDSKLPVHNGYPLKLQTATSARNENITSDYPGIEQKGTFEILLWQRVFNTSYGDGAPPQYNFGIDHNMTELYGAYDYLVLRTTYLKMCLAPIRASQ